MRGAPVWAGVGQVVLRDSVDERGHLGGTEWITSPDGGATGQGSGQVLTPLVGGRPRGGALRGFLARF